MQTLPYNVNVSGRYGAPMGRQNVRGDMEYAGRLNLRRVPFHDGDYDGGGAYWGRRSGGQSLFCAWSPDRSIVVYLDAIGHRDAAAKVREDYDSARIMAKGEEMEAGSRVTDCSNREH